MTKLLAPLLFLVAACSSAPAEPQSDQHAAITAATCTAVPIADPETGPYCQITEYCGIFGGDATVTNGPLDDPPCNCECR